MAYEYKVLEVKQPLGVFYVFKISAFELLQLVDSDPYYLTLEDNKFVKTGVQRRFDDRRSREIANFLKSSESALPNSIIIAGNTKYVDNENKWQIHNRTDTNDQYLVIPELKINGNVIDGQHRLFSFKHLSEEERRNYELLCTLYLELPNPYQAYLFATININQRKVDKSLAYELYGYDLEDEEANKWSPEKLAVYLSRKLNTNDDSVFKGHILLAANNDEILSKLSEGKKIDWSISTAAIVEGILSLITTNAKYDRDVLQHYSKKERERSFLEKTKNNAPLRSYYLDNNDLLIYTIIINFFQASYNVIYTKNTVLYKTIGVQVQFSFLKRLLNEKLEKDKDISVAYFEEYFNKLRNIEFDDAFFQFSGIGKMRLRNTMLIAMGFMPLDEIKNETELSEYKRVLHV